MIRRTAHIILSAWLSILLLFGSTSQEFIHLFTGHEDTVHCTNSHGGELVIEPQHHHCSFLSFELAAFITPVFTIDIPEAKEAYTVQVADAVLHLVPRSVVTPQLRGPPAAMHI